MSKPVKKISLKMPTLMEDQLITAATESDPDALPLTDEQMSTMIHIPVLRAGRPKLANNKQLVSIRYSPEMIDCSGLLELVGKLVWRLFSRTMSKRTPLATLRGPNVKTQKTGANGAAKAMPCF